MPILVILASLALLGSSYGAFGSELTVAVAANFKPAIERLLPTFEAAQGHRVTVVSASTGVLFSQISNGAPFDIFLAADEAAPTRLAEQGIGVGEPFCYARGDLVLVGGDLEALNSSDKTLAIANPTTAPYGRAAMAVIQRAEFGNGENRKLVRANNALQAYQLWRQRTVDLALVPHSLHTNAQALPSDWYPPIEQYALRLKRSIANPTAAAFVTYLQESASISALTELGYRTCHG